MSVLVVNELHGSRAKGDHRISATPGAAR